MIQQRYNALLKDGRDDRKDSANLMEMSLSDDMGKKKYLNEELLDRHSDCDLDEQILDHQGNTQFGDRAS